MKYFKVKTSSMFPSLIVSDKVLVLKTKNYLVGDIVIYKKNDIIICHRIVKMLVDAFIIKGDNSLSTEMIRRDMILGKVIMVNRSKIFPTIIRRLIAFFSFLQSRLAFSQIEENNWSRRFFKLFTNPFLYIVYLRKLVRYSKEIF
mgnify:CR=1 FL=1